MLAIHPIDFGVLSLFFGTMLAMGCYFRGKSTTSREFFYNKRSIEWLPIGFPIVATLVSGWTFEEMPATAYYSGLKQLMIPLAICLTIPLVGWCIVPLYRRQEFSSVHDYLELRFHVSLRYAASLFALACRFLWLTLVLHISCQFLQTALDIPLWLLITVMGLVTTIACSLGGMQGQIWSDVVRTTAMFVGVLVMIVAAWWDLKDGPRRVWDVATILGRTSVVDSDFSWTAHWSLWGVIPHYFLLALSLFTVDQITVQRYLVARTIRDAQWSFALSCLSVSMMTICLTYAGLCLVAFYHEHPEALRIKWVVNVNGETLQSMTYSDRDRLAGKLNANGDARPLLNWDDPQDLVTTESVQQLVAERRLLHPNRKTPLENATELFDPDDPQQLNVETFATRRPPAVGLQHGEVVLNTRATAELLPWFIAHQLPFGITGLALVGVFAAVMSSLNSGINSLATLVFVDFYQKAGFGQSWLARRGTSSKTASNDELQLARFLTGFIGVMLTLCAMWSVGDSNTVRLTLSTFAAPLLGTYLLGLLTRRGTATGAAVALGSGFLFTLWFAIANNTDRFTWLWPFPQQLDSNWPLPCGTLFTFLTGFVVSTFLGLKKNANELRGLVIGHFTRTA